MKTEWKVSHFLVNLCGKEFSGLMLRALKFDDKSSFIFKLMALIFCVILETKRQNVTLNRFQSVPIVTLVFTCINAQNITIDLINKSIRLRTKELFIKARNSLA